MSLALRLGSLALFGGIALWAWWITARAQLLLNRVEQCLDGIDQLLGDVAWHDEEPASTQEHHLDLAGGLPVGRHAAVDGVENAVSRDLRGESGRAGQLVRPERGPNNVTGQKETA